MGATLVLVCSGCMSENLIVALSSSGDGMADDGSGGDTGAGDSGGDQGGDGTSFDLGAGDLDPELLDPTIPPSCAAAWKFPSNMGCSFYALDLDQAGLFDHDPFGVVVTNVQFDQDATVVIERIDEGEWFTVSGPDLIASGETLVFPLPDHHHAGSGVFHEAAYRITADVPVAALQASPISGGLSWSSGASLLHPVSAWTAENHVLGWRTSTELGQPAYVSIVAAVDATPVAVTPSILTAAGMGLLKGQPGKQIQLAIDAGDMVQFAGQPEEIDPIQGLTGTVIQSGSEHPVGVFSAHACAGLPDVVDNHCGHMQEQLNMHLAGETFVVPRLMVRDAANPDPILVQLYGLEDMTVIDFVPGPGTSGVPLEGLTLERGEGYATWVTAEDATAGNFVVHADKPFLMAAYMGNAPPNQVGSPSMVQLAPEDRLLKDYRVSMPPGWDQQMAIIARPADATVSIDGALLEESLFVPLGDYEVARITLAPGQHHIVGSDPFSLLINAVRDGDGYAYLGGWATPTPAFPPPQ
jgi:hypothetical protein